MAIGLISKAQQEIAEKRNNILSGHINVIPSPFEGFDDFPGISQAQYVLVTSFTKGGKTQFTLNLLFNAIYYVFHHRYEAAIHVIYFCLEETDVNITMRFMSWLLNKLDHIRVSKEDLMSKKRAIPEYVLNKINSDEYQAYLKFFEEVVDFSETSNPYGILYECREYCRSVGTEHLKQVTYNDKPVFDYYEQNDKQLWNIMVVDHLSLVSEQKGQTKKQAMDQVSENCAKILRNQYKMTTIIIQQQSTEGESIDAFKAGRDRPSTSGLSDSKYTGRDCQVCIGLYSPFKSGLQSYAGYDITLFRNNIRFMEILINRDGEQGGMLPLLFDGKTATFEALPSPKDTIRMTEVTAKVLDMQGRNTRAMMAFSKKVKHKKKKINGKRIPCNG